MKMVVKILLTITALLAVVWIAGLVLPGERVVERSCRFEVAPQTLYEIVTNNHDWQYRSGLENLVILEDSAGVERWEEHSADGSVIVFQTDEKIPYTSYSFTMDAPMFSGRWTGRFVEDNGGTRFTATERIRVKNPFMRALSYLFFNVGKHMDQYLNDLQRRVSQIPAPTGVTMTAKAGRYPVSSDSLVVTLTNHTAAEVATGERYDIYRSVDGQWQKIALELSYNDIGYVIMPGGSKEFTIHLHPEMHTYSPGRYRIGKSVDGATAYAPFTLE